MKYRIIKFNNDRYLVQRKCPSKFNWENIECPWNPDCFASACCVTGTLGVFKEAELFVEKLKFDESYIVVWEG